MRVVSVTVTGRLDELPAKQFDKLLLAEFFVFFLVGAALDSAVNDIPQLVETDLLIDALYAFVVLKIDLVIIGTIKQDNDEPDVQSSVYLEFQCRHVPMYRSDKSVDSP